MNIMKNNTTISTVPFESNAAIVFGALADQSTFLSSLIISRNLLTKTSSCRPFAFLSLGLNLIGESLLTEFQGQYFWPVVELP